jgi:ABC-type Fe3+/spermidine/putrescine transport system ATPase subunit
MEGVPPYERNIGLVFQSFALFPHLDVQHNVEFGLRMRGAAPRQRAQRALRALATVGMQALAHRRIDQLSGGQKQRVGLARALVTEPAVVLLDEPLGSLDAKLRIEMQSELKSLQRQMGVTFIHVSHNQSEALAMADRIAVMNDGHFEQVGTPLEVYNKPRSRFVAEFVGRNNIFEGEVSAVGGSGTVTVQTKLGAFVIDAHAQAAHKGQRVSFVVRADLMRPRGQEGGGGGENWVAGVLQGLEYAGSTVLVELQSLTGGALKLEMHELVFNQLALRHGSEVHVAFKPAEAYLLP